MQAATSAPFGSANMPLVLVRAMQAVKTIGRAGLGSSALACENAPSHKTSFADTTTGEPHQTAQLMTTAADEIERLNRELRVSR